MRRISVVIMLTCVLFTLAPAPSAQAIDPVTLAILAPIALKVAEAARPYVIRGLMSGGAHMLTMGVDILEILLLPLGFIQVLLLWPFGGFSSGMVNLIKGGVAPFKLALHAVLLPVAFCGISF